MLSGKQGAEHHARVTTLTAAFAHFGAVAKNIAYAWSAVSRDGSTVVLTWWEDEAQHRNGKLVYDLRDRTITAYGDTVTETAIAQEIWYTCGIIATGYSELYG